MAKSASKSSSSSRAGKKAKKSAKGPKRPPSAYILYCNSVRAEVTKANPGKGITELAKIMGGMWKDLNEFEKDKFIKQAASLKTAHDSKHGTASPSKKAISGAGKKKTTTLGVEESSSDEDEVGWGENGMEVDSSDDESEGQDAAMKEEDDDEGDLFAPDEEPQED